MNHQLKKFSSSDAFSICQHWELTERGRPLLVEDIGASQFLDALLQTECFEDSVRFLAFGLPTREAIWWAYLCAEQVEGHDHCTVTAEALALVKAWVFKPENELRLALESLAQKLNMQTATSWLALAVFWSGGSVTPQDTPAVEPATQLTPMAISGAVILAAVRKDPEKAAEKYLHFIQQGLDIANEGNGDV